MTGSLQPKANKWYCVINLKDEFGKRKLKWINTHIPISEEGSKEKAALVLKEQLEQFSAGPIPAYRAEVPFAEYCRQWLEWKKISIAPTTYEGYIYRMKHIEEFFGARNVRLSSVTPRMVNEFYHYLLTKGKGGTGRKNQGLSERSVKEIALLLKAVLENAVILEELSSNPAQKVPIPHKRKTQLQPEAYLDSSEVPVLMSAIKGHELEYAIKVTLRYGLRRSELLGLKWDAIDFDKKTILIRHTVTKMKTIIVQDTTKSDASYRKLPLTKDTEKIFRMLKQRQRINRVALGKEYQVSDYVFTWSDGRPYSPDYVTQAFKRIVMKHPELPQKLTLHGLRRSSISIQLECGIDPKAVQKWHGHADASTTMNIYAGVKEKRILAIGEILDEKLPLIG